MTATAKSCWCYVVNEGYLLPALVSATQLRSHLHERADDILVVCIGEETDVTRAAARVGREHGIEVVVAPLSLLKGLPMYCARLFLCDVLDGRGYDFVTYADADTQFVGDLGDLAAAQPRAGSLLAVPDIMSMTINHPSKALNGCKAYFDKIGIPPRNQRIYFNTGVMKFRSSDWGAISRECLQVMGRRQVSDFLYPDQDALNIVMDGNQTLASFRWNYPAFFIGRKLDDIVAPSIVHFMSRPRPWDGPFPPWGRPAFQPYLTFVEAHPDFAHLLKPARNVRLVRYMLQQAYKQATESWGSEFFRSRIAQFESTAFV
ncbi:glycosyltransferase family 8 protein [Methylobacterium aerolatum]|uniref:Lipopolysaccharide biosynthesis glycosyltransferase n=1 Tax=Methylobacterium aerolatum TaxID=418708 RepID=A0ABU0I1M2_9HYPH|nr:glycosyltransferase [Methylobacterium aerolatum]MDQ0448504.1 lipopolysaccharide biosynthesis glycosyltransferase [Methylobacterium aerolatum]